MLIKDKEHKKKWTERVDVEIFPSFFFVC